MRGKLLQLLVLTLFFTVIMATAMKHTFAVTWSVNLTRFTTDSAFDGLPAITETSDGKIWIVWTKDILGNDTLYYKTSADLGISWSEEQNLTKELGPGQNTSPSIMQAENGTIWVAWSSDRPPPPPPPEPDFTIGASPQNLTIAKGNSDYSTITITSLLNFSEPVNLSQKTVVLGVDSTFNPNPVTPPPNGIVNSTMTISVDPLATPGNYTLTVLGKSSNKSHSVNVFLEIIDVGGAASNNTPKFSSSNESSSQVYDYEIFYKTSNDNGATWSSDIQLTNNTEHDHAPSIVQLSNGTILVAWQWEKANNTDIYYQTTFDGVTWSDVKRLTTNLELDRSPSVMQAVDGKIWVTWASNRSDNFEIFYKIFSGTSWSNDTQMTSSTYIDSTPSILQTVDGTIWIFWSSSDLSPSATADIYYKHSSDNGASWSNPPVQFTTDDQEDMWPSVFQTRDTKIWVAWTSNRADQPDGNWDIYYRTSLAGDANEDGVVDMADVSLISLSFGYRLGDVGYNPDADLNKDDLVDMRDLTIVAFYYGQT